MSMYRAQNAFVGGEISPRLYRRNDLASYKNSVSLLENFIIFPHGGITARPGTLFGWQIKDSTKETRIIPFEVDQDTSYVLEMGPGYFRFGKYGERVSISAPAAWSNATTYGHGDLVVSGGVNYYSLKAANLNKAPASNPDWWYALTGSIYEIPNLYAEAEIPDVRYCQSVDVMWLFHPNHPVYRLERYGDANWLYVPEVFLDGPFGLINTSSTTLVASGATGSVTVTASAAAGINDGQGFLSTDVGRLVRIYGSAWAWGEITARTSATQVTVLVVGGSFPTSPTKSWKLGKYSDTTGYPTVGTLHDNRLVVAGGPDVDASRVGILGDYGVSETTLADDACAFKLLSNQSQPIRWMTSARGGLAVGTMSGEWLMTGGSEDQAVTPTAINAKQHTSIGSLSQQSISTDGATLFVARTGKALHEFAYVYDDNSYQSPDLALLAEHLFRNHTIKYADYQRSSSIVWCVRSDGALLGLTYKRKEQVVGWHRHSTDGTFLDVACVNEGVRDVPYFLIERTVDGNTVRHVEYLDSEFVSDSLADAYLVDCGVKYSGAATNTVSGLDHLEGETVTALADGKVVSGLTVASGIVTLPYTAAKIMVGRGYNSRMGILPIDEMGLSDGASLGRKKAVATVNINFYLSYGGKAGPSLDELDSIIFNENQVFGEAPAPFSGWKSMRPEGSYESDKMLYIQRDLPLPMTINALVVDWTVGEV